MYASGSTAHTLSQSSGCMERIGLPHQGPHFTKDALLGLGDLLHIVALPICRFVTVDVIYTDTI